MKGRYKSASDMENTHTYPMVTIGIVESVTDAMQLGRIYVRCQAWLDGNTPLENLPPTRMCSPFFGVTNNLPRGVDQVTSDGHVSYGQWTIPEVGSQVLVTLVDNDPNQRVWLGSVPELFFSHTLPHGRYLDDRKPKTSEEGDIEPLSSNLGEAFNGDRESAEYATRAMDRQVSAYPENQFGDRIVASAEADQQEQTIENPDGTTVDRTQGYVDGRSKIHSITTPGFHSISMDDDPNSCRMRFRTTAGSQVILDDTNERIYISTSKGKTWIEIDEKGGIDIYGEEDISIKSDADINLYAQNKIRMGAKNGIHMTSGDDIRMHSKTDTHIKTDADLKIHSNNIKLEADTDFIATVAGKFDQTSDSIVISAISSYDLTTPSYKMKSDGYDFDGTNIKATGDIFSEGNVHAAANVSADGVVTAPSAVFTGSVSTGSLSASGGISASGGMSSTGSISTTGLLSSSADVVAGNVSLRSHLHMVPLPAHAAGTIPSPPPVPSAAALPVTPPTPTPEPAPIVAPIATTIESSGSTAEELPANFVSRVPQHEPFTRTYLKLEETDKESTGESTLDLFAILDDDVDSISEYISTDPNAGTGSVERNKDFNRNVRWRR